MNTVTQWFTEPPAKPGVYEVDVGSAGETEPATVSFSNWDGERWSCVCLTPESAGKWASFKTGLTVSRWRGLADNPEPPMQADPEHAPEPMTSDGLVDMLDWVFFVAALLAVVVIAAAGGSGL